MKTQSCWIRRGGVLVLGLVFALGTTACSDDDETVCPDFMLPDAAPETDGAPEMDMGPEADKGVTPDMAPQPDMLASNIDIVKAVEAAINAGDTAAALKWFTPTSYIEIHPSLPPGGNPKTQGLDALKAFFDDLKANNYKFTLKNIKEDTPGIVTADFESYHDATRGMGIAPLTFSEVWVLDNQRVMSITDTLEEPGLTKAVDFLTNAGFNCNADGSICICKDDTSCTDSVAGGKCSTARTCGCDTDADCIYGMTCSGTNYYGKVCTSGPASVVKGFVQAINDLKNTDAEKYLTDDIKFHIHPSLPPGGSPDMDGIATLKTFLKDLADNHFKMDIGIKKVDGDKVYVAMKSWHDATTAMGLAPITWDELYVMGPAGKIKEVTDTLVEPSLTKLVDFFTGAGLNCSSDGEVCLCNADAACAGTSAGALCDATTTTCTCAADTDCPTGKTCSGTNVYGLSVCK